MLSEAIDELRLVDHHVHGPLRVAPTLAEFGNMTNEADTDPIAPDVDCFDTQLGFAIRAHCAPLLDLPPHASSGDYWARRQELGEAEVNRRMLTAAGVDRWLIDTGFTADLLLDPDEMATVSGAPADEIVRLEQVIEQLAAQLTPAADFADRFRALLRERTAHAVGTKTILAYRCGFDVDLSRPSDAEIATQYGKWLADSGPAKRVTDPRIMAFGIHEALELKLPVQFHVGLGDRDMDLRASDPLFLTEFLRSPQARRASILLLHCYPFEREAGYLAQAFQNVYLDVGLAVNYIGAQSTDLIARSLELAPFHKVLYSSDAFGPAELHFLGAKLWRRGITRVLSEFIARGEWSEPDALRVAELIAETNALRAYPRLNKSG